MFKEEAKKRQKRQKKVWSPRVSLQRPLLTPEENDGYPGIRRKKQEKLSLLKEHMIINIFNKFLIQKDSELSE